MMLRFRARTILMSVAVLACLNSCKYHDEFDMSGPIDTTVGISGDLAMPLGSTELITIGSLLEIEEGAVIRVDEATGNYMLWIDGGDPSTESISVPEIDLGVFPEKIGDIHMPVDEQYANRPVPEVGYDVVVYDKRHEIRLNLAAESELPEEIAGIRHVGVMSEATVRLTTSLDNIILKAGSYMEMPEFLEYEFVRASSDAVVMSGSRLNVIRDMRISAGVPLEVDLNLVGVDVTRCGEGTGHVVDADGSRLVLDGDMLVIADVKAVSSDYSVVPEYIEFAASVEYSDITVKDADLKVKDIAVDDSFTMELNDVPEFLGGENCVLSLYNPVLMLSVDNPSPFSVWVNADVEAIRGGEAAESFHLGDLGGEPLLFRSGSTAGIYMSPRGSAAPAGAVDLKVPAIASFLRNLPEEISVSGLNLGFGDEYLKVQTGRDYAFSYGYSFFSDLAFGSDLMLRYSQDITGIGGISMDEEGEGGMAIDVERLVLKMDVENSIPLSLGLQVEAIDLDGNLMPGVNVGIDGEIAAGGSSGATVSHVELTLSSVSAETLASLDGVRLTMTLGCPAESEGLPVNRAHGIRLSNVSVRLAGSVQTTLDM